MAGLRRWCALRRLQDDRGKWTSAVGAAMGPRCPLLVVDEIGYLSTRTVLSVRVPFDMLSEDDRWRGCHLDIAAPWTETALSVVER